MGWRQHAQKWSNRAPILGNRTNLQKHCYVKKYLPTCMHFYIQHHPFSYQYCTSAATSVYSAAVIIYQRRPPFLQYHRSHDHHRLVREKRRRDVGAPLMLKVGQAWQALGFFRPQFWPIFASRALKLAPLPSSIHPMAERSRAWRRHHRHHSHYGVSEMMLLRCRMDGKARSYGTVLQQWTPPRHKGYQFFTCSALFQFSISTKRGCCHFLLFHRFTEV